MYSGTPARLVPHDCCHEYYQWKILGTGFKPFIWSNTGLSVRVIGKIIQRSDIVYIPSNALIPISILAKKYNSKTKVIVHLHDYQPLVYMASLLHDRNPGIRNDITVEYLTSNSVLRSIIIGYAHFLNWVNKTSLRTADSIICVSNTQRRIITKYIREIAHKTITIYNLYPKDVLNVKKKINEPLLIYMGSENYSKGFYIFLAATHKLLSEHSNIARKTKIYLTGNIRTKTLRLIQSLNMIHGHRYHYVGRVNRTELLELYSRSWGLLFPSIYEEPLPYAVLEAGLSGVIPIAADVGGVREIIGESTAEKYMFKPGDINGFTYSMKQLLSLTPNEIIRNGYMIRKKILEKFDRMKILEKLYTVFTV